MRIELLVNSSSHCLLLAVPESITPPATREEVLKYFEDLHLNQDASVRLKLEAGHMLVIPRQVFERSLIIVANED